ncbi:MAG: fumarate hydratase [Candidatus Omnitrophota bacterium]
MKTISAAKIQEAVSDLCLIANLFLRSDVLALLKSARAKETNQKARRALAAIIENAAIAKKERLAICQDTGMPCVFVEAGQGVRISGDLTAAINKGVEAGYKKGYFRNSVVKNPLLRGKSAYSPVVIHTEITSGNRLKLTVLPKGFGSENKTQLKMFRPTATIDDVKRFIVESVKAAGSDACPPYIIGIGIGGTAEYACLLAKKALIRKMNVKTRVKLEADLLKEINKLNIGPMGLGGKHTALSVNVETYPTHIAGLPVCVNISCHALRSASIVL